MPSKCSRVAWKSCTWDGLFDDVVAEIVGGAEDEPGLHAAAGHPDAEAPQMVVATVVGGG